MGKTSCFCIDNTVFPVFHDGNKRGAAEILVPDLFGNIVLTERLAAMKGQIKSTLSLSLSHLATGIYFVSVTDGENIKQGKVMVR